ncbi:hypothetical protein BKA63DRAFT_139748 [Paraphoma chrysanthemicola]|nr:hypothetical protein BKA63DRAFT_139748 [Paraphoma chrysanthemicola]
MQLDVTWPDLEDFQGLRQIYPQSNDVETHHDLVVVHGLAAGSISTWKHESGVLWLQWLTSAIPSQRILVYGYKAEEVSLNCENETDSGNRVFVFSESLCAALRSFRTECKSPITFLSHGVGGIIVKNALTYCAARPSQFGDILDKTHHLIFMETPHRGLDIEKWKPAYTNQGIASAQIRLWSTVLRDLSTLFAEIANRIGMHITTVEASEPVELVTSELIVCINVLSTLAEAAVHIIDI